MTNTSCYDRECNFATKKENEILSANNFVLPAAAAILAVLLLAAMLLSTALR